MSRSTSARPRRRDTAQLAKTPTGIRGLDEITLGGLPRGRPTLVCGATGCGKTLLAAEFLIRGITEFGEPGVFMAFEETADDLTQNVASLGFDLNDLVRRKKLVIDHVRVERSEIDENGEYDLEGLFVRLNYAINSVGAKRVVLDTIEALFSGLSNQAILRAEIRRLFAWLKQKGVTAVITGERGAGQLTRQGLEEYVSDCVILLDHRVENQVTTRRLRVVKYRGSTHGTNEYPFLIDDQGISVLPITSMTMQHRVSGKRIATGVAELDAMLGGRGYFAGSTVLISGTAGTGKTSLCAHTTEAHCRLGGRCAYFAFEESGEQVSRNMRSIGINLTPWVKRGLLQIHSARPALHGLEMHLVLMHRLIEQFRPELVIIDPITNLMDAGTPDQARAMLVRLVDYLKGRGITSFFTTLTSGLNAYADSTEVGISSLVDTWLLLRMVEIHGQRDRVLYILKSRGMAHSNRIRRFELTGRGVRLLDDGPIEVVSGPAHARAFGSPLRGDVRDDGGNGDDVLDR